MTRGTRKLGQVCWINMLTPKPAEARAFFSHVLGWTYAEIPRVGHRIQVGGRDIGGLFDVVSAQTPQGTAPIVGVMIKVENADASAARVKTLGGKARAAFDIGDDGRLSVCHDPNGAEFDLWQPKRMHGTDVDSSLPGAPSWFEVFANELERVGEFYAKLLGWTVQTTPSPTPDSKYDIFQLSGEPVAGAMLITPRMGGAAPRWRTYFTTGDIESATRRAVELGAKLEMSIKDVPGGRVCGLRSPHGVEFCLSERQS
jgi:predicted enzyme related to lactoylglutathione lyase